MAKTTPGNTTGGGTSNVVRAAVAADESGTAVADAGYPPANATSCAGWRTIAAFPRFTNGTAPKVTVQILHRVTLVSGNGWMVGPMSAPLAEGESFIFETFGRDFYVRVYALSGTPDSVDIHAAGWQPYRYDGPTR